MSRIDALKVLILLAAAVAVVALICFARVDLGMSWDQMNAKMGEWKSSLFVLGFIVWSVAITLFFANRRTE